MKLSDFFYELPQEKIAQYPVTPKDSAKLLIWQNGEIQDKTILDFPNYLTEKDIIIFNESKVIKAFLEGHVQSGGKVSINLNEQQGHGIWRIFARPAKKLKNHKQIIFAPDFVANILEVLEDGEFLVEFPDKENFWANLDKYGKMPLPHYIKELENETRDDAHLYQTIFAKNDGSVAAPTASLHFTQRLLDKIKEKNIQTGFVTLHVGSGTFLPVKTENIHDHKMHFEYAEISQELCDRIKQVKADGGRVMAVGTTATRVLETASRDSELKAFSGKTNLFITPGCKFNVVDILLTNFHLPQSTLIMLVSAFAGLEETKSIYNHAINNDYRFYSYGDASLIFRNNNAV